MTYRFLEHTADAQAECRAADFPGLLAAGARALYALALIETRADAGAARTIEVTADSREDALVRWLQELIFLLDAERFVATRFEFTSDDPTAVRAVLCGYECTPEERAGEVKSATYHEIDVREDEHGLVARVIFDL